MSADQRFVLHVNGRRVGIGPSRGDILFWRFETFDLAPFLKPGPNLVSAIVWNFGTQAPAAQITDRTGFVVQGDGDAERAANTDASWECAPEPGHQPWPEGLKPLREEEPQYLVVGPRRTARRRAVRLGAGPLPPPRERRPAAGSRPSSRLSPRPRSISVGPGYQLTPDGRLLVPDELPPMEYRTVPAGRVVKVEGATVEGFPESGPARVPPNTKASLLVDRKTLVDRLPGADVLGRPRVADPRPATRRRSSSPRSPGRRATATTSRASASSATRTRSSPTAARDASSTRCGGARGAT